MALETRKRCALTLGQLRRECDPDSIVVGSQAGVIGQTEAMEALDLGLCMNDGDYSRQRYNICVVGSPNTGRTTKTVMHLREHAAKVDFSPDDVVCLHNWENQRKPVVAFVPNGQGGNFRHLVVGLKSLATLILPRLSAKTMEEKARALYARREFLISAANQVLKGLDMCIVEEEEGNFMVGQLKDDGQPMTIDDFQALSEEERTAIEEKRAAYKDIVDTIGAQLVKDLNALVKEMGEASGKLLEENRGRLQDHADAILKAMGGDSAIAGYLNGLVDLLAKVSSTGIPGDEKGLELLKTLDKMTEVNVLVDNTGVVHPPVIHATEPQYSRLFGRINGEPGAEPGTVRVDHTMVEAGEWLRANGGFLALDMGQLLKLGGGVSFYKFLQVIRNSRLTIEGKASFLDLGSIVEHRVEDIPVNVRVIVICDRYLAHLLRHIEPDFENLFRITAEFDSEMSVGEATSAYPTFLALFTERGEILPVSKPAAAKLVEFGSRRAGDRHKASTEFGVIKDVATEASHWAKAEGAEEIGPSHVKRAIDERFRRQTLLIRRYREMWDKGMILLDNEGTRVGVVNGLVVMGGRSEFSFGMPKRVSARAFAGKDKFILVQREAETSGPSSNTAIATIRGWLAGQYGRKKPISLGLQISFEQTYGGVDGDSASVAEILAVLSAITGLPVDQRLVVTGSMNQWGEVQPIGGVNHKVEGHVGLLNRKAILGVGHGAVIPVQNLDDLMLNDEVVEAQASGQYRIYAIRTIDEAIEIFFGLPADYVHKQVRRKLAEIGAARKPWFFIRWFRLFLSIFARKAPTPQPDFAPPPSVEVADPPEHKPFALEKRTRRGPAATSTEEELAAIDDGWDEPSSTERGDSSPAVEPAEGKPEG